MAQIVVEHLRRGFRVAERDPGMLGAFRGLLRRRHREVLALEDLSFRIEAGELVGYIGPNGAGKSTTIKILCGVLVPTSGTCTVDGLVPWQSRAQHVARIGAVFGQRTQLWWDLPTIESFELLREIYRVPMAAWRQNLDELVQLLDIASLLDVPVRQLSLGQRMRCDLVAALLHAPRILFLDEPTIGLDAASKLAVRHFVQRLNRERGVTVILTTHDMDDIEALCERVLVIHQGRLLVDGGLASLRARLGGERRLIAELADDAHVEPLPGTRILSQGDGRVVFGFDPAAHPVADVINALMQRCSVRDLTVEHQPIEEVVATLYRDAPALVDRQADERAQARSDGAAAGSREGGG
jgi:ABC-2 type transport system ATP-binding protein